MFIIRQTNRVLDWMSAAVCGMLGYRDLFEREWLRAILSWQRNPPGCWPVDDDMIAQPLLHHFKQTALGEISRRLSSHTHVCIIHVASSIDRLAYWFYHILFRDGNGSSFMIRDAVTHDPWPLHHFILRMGLGGAWHGGTGLYLRAENRKLQ